MVYLNYKWENKFPITTIKVIFIGFLIIATVLLGVKLKKGQGDNKYSLGVLLANILTLVYVIIGGLNKSAEYYAIVLLLIFLIGQANLIYFITNRIIRFNKPVS